MMIKRLITITSTLFFLWSYLIAPAAAVSSPCVHCDINSDMTINVLDIVPISKNIGTFSPIYDVNLDQRVDIEDVKFAGNYLNEKIEPPAKKIFHAIKEDFNAGTKIGVDVLDGGIITLKRKDLGEYETINGNYISPYIDMGEQTTPFKLGWTSSENFQGNIKYQIRSATTLSDLNSTLWYGPTNTDDYYSSSGEEGANLLSNPSIENDSNLDGIPNYTKTGGWGTNNQIFTVFDDSYDGSKALKVEITNYTNGDARWEVMYNGTIENSTYYSFSVWHKENSDIGQIQMQVGYEMADGSLINVDSLKFISSSSKWKKDDFIFLTPSNKIKVIWMKLVIQTNGWIISDAYGLRKGYLSNEWEINTIHSNSRYLQYKVNIHTENISYSPSLHDITINYGASIPEIHWVNILDNSGNQKYAFRPGEVAKFKAEILDFKSINNLDYVTISIIDPAKNNHIFNANMSSGDTINNVSKYYEYQFDFPLNATLGVWKAEITAVNKDEQVYKETTIMKVRDSFTTPPPNKMTIGALAYDGGFWTYHNPNEIVNIYNNYTGLEIWKLGIAWELLEPEHGVFNETYIDAILYFMDSAQQNNAKVQVSLAQQWWPVWANNGNWDSLERYSNYEIADRLADTWMRLSERIKDHPAFESYLIVNEENHIYNSDVYLRGLTKVTSAIRSVDTNLSNRITIRPNAYNLDIRTRIVQNGAQDYDYGTGVYPTSWAWYLTDYESPISYTSYLRMAQLRSSPVAYGGAGGVGEIGFFKSQMDNLGDNEKLIAFERAMSIAYDQGMDEFMLWGAGGSSFEHPELYFPKLKVFRDNLIKRNPSTYFDVRVLIDNNNWIFKEQTIVSSKLNMSEQPYLYLIKTLDENGYSWYYTHSDATNFQNASYARTIKLSEITGKNATEQDTLIKERLKDIIPTGIQYPWPIQD